MERRLYANDVSGALRAAHRLGGVEPAIVKARAAVNEKSPTAKSLIEALPSSAHQDPGVMFSRIQMLRRADKYHEAAQLMLAAPRDVAQIYDPDEWWVERRVIARKLLDLNQAATAYKIVRDAATPTKENYKVEHEFTAGWIALRFLKEPATAAQHFARIAGITNPIAMARANYWQGRAAEAMNKPQDARAYLRAGGALQHRLLRPARPGEARHARAGAGVLPAAGCGQARGARPQRGRARGRDALRAQRPRPHHPDRGGSRRPQPGHGDARGARRGRRAARRCPQRASHRQGCARPRPAVRSLRLPDLRAAALHRDRTGGRAGRGLFDRAAGERLQSEGRVERAMRSA